MNDFERYLSDRMNAFGTDPVSEAMRYAMEGGKRFRPRILFSILQGMGIDPKEGYEAALALEMIQAYSLVHDDLPAMDNDDLRRGKPTVHKAFGEDIAILAGDALLTHSFGVLASGSYDADIKAKMIADFSDYAGMNGMVYGQLLDLTTDIPSLDENRLYEIQVNKTGGLFRIACLSAMYLHREERKDWYLELGARIGVLFQNQDDLFDIIRSEEEMGKSLSDLKNEKPSAIALYDKGELSGIIDREFEDRYTFLEDASFDPKPLTEVLETMRRR